MIVDNTFSVLALLHSTRYPGSTHDGRRANTVWGYYGIEGWDGGICPYWAGTFAGNGLSA